MKNILIVLILSLIVIWGCNSNNEPSKTNPRYAYYQILHGDSSGFYEYDVNAGEKKLLTKKNIIKATHVADNGRFVILEHDDFDSYFEFHGVCNGDLIEVPLPDKNEYFTGFPDENDKDIPMEIDEAGHNFAFFSYKTISNSQDIYYKPFLVTFNCEEWKMNINDIHDKIDAKTEDSLLTVNVYKDLLYSDGILYFKIGCTFKDNTKQNYLASVINSNIEITPLQDNKGSFLSGIFVEPFCTNAFFFYNNEIVVEESCNSDFTKKNSIDVYNYNNLIDNFHTQDVNFKKYGFNDQGFRSIDLMTQQVTEFNLISDKFIELDATSDGSQCAVSPDGKFIGLSINNGNSHVFLWDKINNDLISIDENDSTAIMLTVSGDITE